MVVGRPVLRYHGGKWLLAPWIASHFPAHDVYVEPYGGGASVLMRKARSRAEVYNDLDEDVVNVFRVLRDEGQAERLREVLALTPYSRTEWKESFSTSDDPVERARRTFVRLYFSFATTSARRAAAPPSVLRRGVRAEARRPGIGLACPTQSRASWRGCAAC